MAVGRLRIFLLGRVKAWHRLSRARIYIRRSDDDQSTYSPEAQERQGRLYCELHGHEVVGIYLDDDLSGTKERERVQFQRLVHDACVDRGSIVIIHKIDHLARDAEVVLRTVKQFDRYTVTLVSVSEQIDFSTPIGRVMLTNLAAFAEYYSRNLSTEVKKGLREKALQGGWIGPVPLGYRKDGATLAPSDDAPIVVLLYTMYATGSHSHLTIAEELNRRGLTVIDIHTFRRGPFSADTVGGILSNPAYLGIVRCGGVEYPGAHPALIDRAVWEQCREIRERRTRQGGGEFPIRGLGGLLSELAYCGHCGARLHSWWTGNAPARVHRYHCKTRRKFGSDACPARMLHGDRIEAQVLDMLRALAIPPRIIHGVLAEVERRIAQPITPRQLDAARIREQLRRLRAAYLAGDPDLTDVIYTRERERLARLLTSEPAPPVRVLDVERAAQLLSDMPGLIEAATTDERRSLVQQVIRQIWLADGAIAGWEPAPNYVLLVEAVAGAVDLVTSTGIQAALFTLVPETSLVSSHTIFPARWQAFNVSFTFPHADSTL
jgi:DNA invertase Pin-like site-specific DNA recombinase